MKSNKTKNIVMAAMFTAIITVMTAYFHINTGVNFGYVHFGDSVIYLAACILPPPYALFAASAGGALADIISGAPIWAVPTAIIKALNIVPFLIVMKHLRKKGKDNRIISAGTAVAAIISGIITIAGYFIAEGLLFSFTSAALASILRGIIQPIGSAVIFYGIGLALDKAKCKSILY